MKRQLIIDLIRGVKCKHTIITDECKHCKSLQNKWYRKLEKSFTDIEDYKKPDRPLKDWHKFLLTNTTIDEIENKHDYYEKALKLLRTFEFKNETFKRIWELHCEGRISPQIEKDIKKMANAVKQFRIRQVIQDMQREMEW